MKIIFGFFFSLTTLFVSSQELSGILPKNGSNQYLDTINLFWNVHPLATNYSIEMSQSEDFSFIEVNSGIISENNWTTLPLGFGNWFWRAIANTPNGQVFGETQFFVRFDPSQITELNLWLKADTGVTLDLNNKVSNWNDLSPNSFNLNQSNSAKRPNVLANGMNGIQTVHFSGGQVLEGGDILDLGNTSKQMFVIGQFTGNQQTFYAKSNSVSAPSRYAFMRFNGTTAIYQETTDNHLICPTTNNSFGLYQYNNNRLSSQKTIYLNNSQIGSNGINSLHSMQSSFRFLVGAFNGSNDVGETFYLNGNISEMVFIEGTSLNDQNSLRLYFRDKYIPPLDLGIDTKFNLKFCDTILSITSGYSNILWSTGSTATSISVNEGLYWVEGKDIFGYTKRDTILISYPTIPPPLNTAICSGSSNTWNADMGPGFTYLWSNGATTPSIDISTPGTYNVTVFDSFGCSKNSGNYVFTIDNYPNTASLGLDTSMCLGNTIELQVGAPETVNYSWNGDASPSQPGSFVPNSTGEYTLECTNNNGCVARDTIIVTISGVAPVANFLVDNFCYQDALQCTDASTAAGSDPLATWSWDFGDGNQSSDQNPTHVYDSPGYYLVELYVESTGGCGENLFVPVQIRTLPFADLSYVGYCDNAGTQFNDNSVEGEGTINSWFWNFGQPGGSGSNTSILQSPSKDYGTPGDYTVYFQVTDAYGCQDDTTFVLSILEAPQTIFTADDACENATVPLSNASTIGSPYVIQSQLWDFGDGTFSILPVPNKSYSNFGYHTITLTTTADNGCADIEQVQILVHSTPVPMFSVGPACVGTYTELNDVSTVTTGWIGGSNWEIDLNDNIQGITTYYQFQTEGSHNVELTTTSNFGCSASGMFIFDVGPELSADWDSYPLTIVTGVPVQFDHTGAGSEYWDWNMGNGEHIYFTDHSYTYGELWADSTIDISLYVSNSEGCEDTLTRTFTVERAFFDLEVEKILLNEVDGFMNVGVQLHNKGTSLIDSVEVELVFSSGLMLKETFASVLQSDQTEIMVFTSLPSSFVSVQNGEPDWICAEGLPFTTLNLTETDLENNKVCLNRENEEPVIIGPYPNPASESFDLELFITSESTIDLKLIDAKGRLVLLLVDGYTYPQGLYEFHVPLLSIQSGVFFLEMVNGDTRTLKKLMVE